MRKRRDEALPRLYGNILNFCFPPAILPHMKNEAQKEILSQIEQGYDRMAEKFSGTRSFFWRDLEFIKDHIKPKDKILDFGCGNGRLFEFLKDKSVDYYGVDVSQNLINIARERYPNFSKNITKNSGKAKLSFPDNYFDVVVSIAVFHHFPDKKYREDWARELHRITKPGGKIIITCWNLWQKRYRKYIWKDLFKKLIGQNKLGFLDCEIPFKNNAGEVFTRFHHAYTKKELGNIFEKADFRKIKVDIINNKNLVLIGKK